MTAAAVAAALSISAIGGAVPASAVPDTGPSAGGPPTVLFVVDVSGSMAGSRLTQAKQALEAGASGLREGQAAGLLSFSGACSSNGSLLVPVAAGNRAELQTSIEGLRAGGGTPTPGALRGAANQLRGVAGPKVIVLVSDGQSSCGNPCPTAGDIKDELGIDFRAVTVGFQVGSQAAGELRCIADATGGEYFSADDAEGLAAAIGAGLAGSAPGYVAIGDSTTTGHIIETCDDNRVTSPFGCIGAPPATPYPERVLSARPEVGPLSRVGIWGYGISEAVEAYRNGRNEQGLWTPQLVEAERATDLVTVSLGANDMNFSDIPFWMGQCIGVGPKAVLGRIYPAPELDARDCRSAANARATAPALSADMDTMFDVLGRTRDNGATVLVTLYFNPINDRKHVRFFPDRSCALLHGMGEIITGEINAELERRARAEGFVVADFGPAFAGHGSGAEEPYVAGTECEAVGALAGADIDFGWPPVDVDQTQENIQIRFDPHPNDAGLQVQADEIMEALR